jgi:hypothetical protein
VWRANSYNPTPDRPLEALNFNLNRTSAKTCMHEYSINVKQRYVLLPECWKVIIIFLQTTENKAKNVLNHTRICKVQGRDFNYEEVYDIKSCQVSFRLHVTCVLQGMSINSVRK